MLDSLNLYNLKIYLITVYLITNQHLYEKTLKRKVSYNIKYL